ncbi:MAG: hypothetical protein ACNA8H_03370, partial [Anaerolineales bacterium]
CFAKVRLATTWGGGPRTEDGGREIVERFVLSINPFLQKGTFLLCTDRQLLLVIFTGRWDSFDFSQVDR